jgi:hypothetical protein
LKIIFEAEHQKSLKATEDRVFLGHAFGQLEQQGNVVSRIASRSGSVNTAQENQDPPTKTSR